jgi:putative FmdB family regulatory protein
MPFYEYQCSSCGHALEAMQKVSDAPLKKCPHCGKAQLQKLMSAPVFRLKGAGWYETDFKSDQDTKRNLADRPEAEAAKDDKKETAESASKDSAAPDAAKTADKPAEKGAEKPAEKAAPAESAKKPAAGAVSSRGAASVNKSNQRKPVKRPVRRAVKSRAAKPARRR